MSKKVKVLVSVLVAVVLLTVGGAATVMANDGSTATDNETGRRCLQARVAEKLGIPSDNMTNAFKLSRQEMREGAFIRLIDKALENECITEDDYDEIIGWLETRPEVLDSLFPCSFGASALGSRHMWGARINQAILGKHMWGGYKGWHRPSPPEQAD